MDKYIADLLKYNLMREAVIKEEDIVVRDAVPPDFGLEKWGTLGVTWMENSVGYLKAIVIKGVGEVAIQIDGFCYRVSAYKDYAELYLATLDGIRTRKLGVANKVGCWHLVELKKIIRPGYSFRISAGRGVQFIPVMFIAERVGVFIDDREVK